MSIADLKVKIHSLNCLKLFNKTKILKAKLNVYEQFFFQLI